jgi:glycosyltransferase involved in cell wall biosynthesis
MSKFGIGENHWLIRALKWQEQISARFAHKVICVHEPHRQVLCGRGLAPGKLTVLPNVPDPRIFGESQQSAAGRHGFRMVYHGTIARRLGLDLAVEAFSMAAGRCLEARFDIFGEGDAADELEAKIAVSPVRDRIRFTRGMFRVEEIAQMVAGASAGVVPNRRDLATEYMLPVKLLEYAYLGIPVIAPHLKTIAYYFNDEQICGFEPGVSASMAEAIVRLYQSPTLSAELARNAAEVVRALNWETLQAELFRVVDEWGDKDAVALAFRQTAGAVE